MSTNSFPLVGAYHWPPAQALIDALAVDTPLTLWAEPTNQYDPNAIAVFLKSSDIPTGAYDRLAETLPPHGTSLDEVLAQELWQLGYIAKAFAAELKLREIVKDDEPVTVSFALNPQGQPRVRFAEAPY